jgi:hypothetical protein
MLPILPTLHEQSKIDFVCDLSGLVFVFRVDGFRERLVRVIETTVVHSERYGGRGVGTNGGGVRCGNVDGIQIKGVGPNPLRGKNRDFFHSYGGASLNECMYETVWSEVLANELPHGSARSLAIAKTGERVPLLAPKKGQDPTTPGALLFREPCLRPAHYMRAIDFDPIEDFSMYPTDVERTRAAIQSLPETLRTLFGKELTGAGKNLDDTFELLTPIFTRSAEQIAAARAKRIMHGSLIDSNFSIDGRWLDFSTTSAVPDFAPLVISPGAPDFLSEERLIYQTIGDLVIYVEKYGNVKRGFVRERADALAKAMSTCLNERLPFEFAKLTGIPSSTLKEIDSKLITALFAAQMQLIVAAKLEPMSILGLSDDEAIEFLSSTGQRNQTKLNEAMRLLALASDHENAHNRLATFVPNEVSRGALVAAYFELRRAALDKIEADQVREFGPTFFALNATRLNADVRNFYRPALYGDIEKTILNEADVAEFVDGKIAEGRVLFGESAAEAVDLSGWCCSAAQVSSDGKITLNDRAVSIDEFLLAVSNRENAANIESCIQLFQ